MLKRFVFLLVIAALAGGGYYYYKNWYQPGNLSAWSFISGNAVLVYETSDLVNVWNNITEKDSWKSLSKLPGIGKIHRKLQQLDSVSGKSGNLDRLLKNKPLVVSMHITSREDFDFAFYVEVRNIEEHTLIRGIIDYFNTDNGYRSRTRKYQGYTITEISEKSSEEQFTFIFYRNFFICSFTPFLVEDAIRTIDMEGSSFMEDNSGLIPLAKISQDAGNLYLNSRKLNLLAGVFADELKADLNHAPHLTSATFLDLTINHRDLLFTGFSINDPTQVNYLNGFDNNEPGPFDALDYIPINAAIAYQMTWQDPFQWQLAMRDYWSAYSPALINQQNLLREEFDINVDNFFKWITDEMALVVLESPQVERSDKLLLVKANDIGEALNQLNRISETISNSRGDSVYRESYTDRIIQQVPIDNFPRMVFGNLCGGFDQTFYLPIDQYIVMGNQVQVLKDFLDNVNQENTWGKSVKINRFVENALDEANLSMFINVPRAWNHLLYQCSPKWKRFFEEHAMVFRDFEMASVQFSNLDNNYYTSIAIAHNPSPTVAQIKQYDLFQSVRFPNPLTSKPFVVRNHSTRQFEVVVQDESNNLYLISNDGEILWSGYVNGKIVTDIEQLDYYRNGKLQYLFGTEDALYIVDRNGNYLPGYPKSMPENVKIQQLALIDYDNSKRYRFLISDQVGNLYLFDKNGQNLEGWDPKTLSKSLACPPRHIRVRGKDYMIALESNGLLNVFNRRGQLQKGFPVDLKGPVQNPMFIQIGSAQSSTRITTITDDGRIVEVNLNGEIVRREQVYRPSGNTIFRLCIDALGKSYIFSRQEQNRVAIMDRAANTLFEKDYITPDNIDVQYYNFGAGNEVIAITDKDQEFSYLYDNKGALINYQPLESASELALLYYDNSNTFRLYKNYAEEFSILSFNR